MELDELAPGLWRWDDSLYVERPDAVVLIDPVVPAGEEERFFRALDRDVERLGLPVVVLLTDRVLDADVFVERYGAEVFRRA
ncbi:MAG TPA: hypothetical protein VG073_01310 [Gaiellaceae bacterium]|nr:hypothetical protein [Gaiellaceae bacterium]